MATRAALEKNDLRERNPSHDTISSDLPDDILQHIFSFLPFKSIVQTTLLSKHWKHLCLWRSHPHLDFSLPSPEPGKQSRPSQELFRLVRKPSFGPHLVSPELHHPLQARFHHKLLQARFHHKLLSKATEFVPDVLSRRDQGSNITTFRLFGHVSYSCLRDCIDRVMHHGIEKLELDVYVESGFNLPPGLFHCNTLRVLKLNHQNKHPVRKNSDHVPKKVGRQVSLVFIYGNGHFNYPTSAGLPSVHTLSLTNVHLKYGSNLFSGENVHLKYGSNLFSGEKFPLLRKLCLKTCTGMHDLNINCPGLEILELDGLGLHGLDSLDISCIGLLELQVTGCFRDDSRAKIFAPSLRRFYWEESVNVICTMESFEYLNTGSVYFRSKPANPKKPQSAATFISALCFARSLSVRSQVLEILSKGGLPYSFNNLTTLELQTDLKKYQITGILCFLNSSPMLHTIIIGVDCLKTDNEILDASRYWRSQSPNLKSTIECHLKVARIDTGGTRVSKSVIYLVKFLLMCETALQEMTLTLKNDLADPPLTRQRIRSKIKKFAPPSCNVIVSFLPQD